jgi:hypothetical protein
MSELGPRSFATSHHLRWREDLILEKESFSGSKKEIVAEINWLLEKS